MLMACHTFASGCIRELIESVIQFGTRAYIMHQTFHTPKVAMLPRFLVSLSYTDMEVNALEIWPEIQYTIILLHSSK